MRKAEITEELLYKYMSALDEKLLSTLPGEEEINYQFSEAFEQRMNTLKKRVRQKKKYGIPVTTWRRIAAMLVIVLAGVFVASMSVEAVREKIFNFVETIYETYTLKEYHSDQEMVDNFIPLYPTYVPEGYELIIEDLTENSLFLSYEENDGEGNIIIDQQLIVEDLLNVSDSEYIKVDEVKVQGVNGKVGHKANGITRIKWEKNHVIYFVSAKDMDIEKILKICESLK